MYHYPSYHMLTLTSIEESQSELRSGFSLDGPENKVANSNRLKSFFGVKQVDFPNGGEC
jgi:hypothetical protein